MSLSSIVYGGSAYRKIYKVYLYYKGPTCCKQRRHTASPFDPKPIHPFQYSNSGYKKTNGFALQLHMDYINRCSFVWVYNFLQPLKRRTTSPWFEDKALVRLLIFPHVASPIEPPCLY